MHFSVTALSYLYITLIAQASILGKYALSDLSANPATTILLYSEQNQLVL
jgi:hypothetical protein